MLRGRVLDCSGYKNKTRSAVKAQAAIKGNDLWEIMFLSKD